MILCFLGYAHHARQSSTNTQSAHPRKISILLLVIYRAKYITNNRFPLIGNGLCKCWCHMMRKAKFWGVTNTHFQWFRGVPNWPGGTAKPYYWIMKINNWTLLFLELECVSVSFLNFVKTLVFNIRKARWPHKTTTIFDFRCKRSEFWIVNH